jgi:hypothetical protein
MCIKNGRYSVAMHGQWNLKFHNYIDHLKWNNIFASHNVENRMVMDLSSTFPLANNINSLCKVIILF